jgi:D-serine deaminase-like pyridoxal phosphate-dependent protein
VTELRPGTYVYFDRTQVALGAARVEDCALTVLAMVVSKPAADRVVLDCGSKTLSTDPPRGFSQPEGYGAVFRDLDARVVDATCGSSGSRRNTPWCASARARPP